MVELHLAAPPGLTGTVVVDLGLVEALMTMTTTRSRPSSSEEDRRDDDTRRRLVVIGNGMAGARTVEEILARGGAEQFAITMFGDEPYGNYNRIMLSHVLSGEETDDGHLPQQPGLVRRERHHPARRGPGQPDRPLRQAWCSPTTARSPRTTS